MGLPAGTPNWLWCANLDHRERLLGEAAYQAHGMQVVAFSNRMPAFVWVFTLVWLALLLLFTGLMVRDGSPEASSPAFLWAVLAVFWLGGVGLTSYALSQPCYFVTVDKEGLVRFTWQYPHRRLVKRFATEQLAPPRVVEIEDDEGNPYFSCCLDLPDGRRFKLAEAHDRSICEQACQRFSETIPGQGQAR